MLPPLACPLEGAEPGSDALAALTYSGSQDSLVQLDRDITTAGTDSAKLAALERDLLALLRRREATFAARQAVAQRLGRVLALGPAKTEAGDFKPLASMLLDERDSDLARLALEPAAGVVIDRMFVEALDQTTGRTRLGILESIARRRTESAVPLLVKLLQDPDAAISAGAANALGQIATPAAVAALHAIPEPSTAPVATAKLAAASRLPPTPALGLLNELQRKAAAPALRAAAFRQALDIELGTAAARIATVLGGRDWTMKQAALEAIAASRAPNLGPTLAGKLGTWDAPTQRAVIAALGRRGEAGAVPAIVGAVRHKDPDVRAEAIEALGRLPGSRDTALLLINITASAGMDDAKVARQALARLNGPEVDTTLMAGAARGEPKTRVACIEQLALRNMTDSIPFLLQQRSDSDASVRLAAVAALGEIGGTAEKQALLEWTIQASDPAEQSRALRSLINLALREPDEGARGHLLFAAIESAPAELALRLLPALGRIGGATAAATAARLAIRGDTDVSEAATDALVRWSDLTALPALATVAEKARRPEARTAAVEGALAQFERNREPWTAESTTVVSRLVGSTDDVQSRRNLLRLLHRASDEPALALAQRLTPDAALGADAAMAAEIIKTNRAGPPALRASNPDNVANLMDGKTSTRWTTPALGEEWVEVEFKLSRPLTRVTLDQTGRAAEFPERYEVYVTDTPAQPGPPAASGTGQRGKTVIDLPANTRGRYLIVKNVAERKETPWAICELYVD